MSTSSPRLELHTSDSPVLYPIDSVSAPSEPPDIRNWFPSFIYESPVLNTFDDLQDLDGSGETCLQEGKKRKAGENQPVGNSNYGLLSEARKSSRKIIKCHESDEFEHSKCAALVTGSSESLSFSSEPPDIKNWFSSYLYESSPLDTAEAFTISDMKVREDDKMCISQKSCKQEKDVLVMGITDVEESTELPTQIRTSNIVVKCTNLVKDSKLDYQPFDKDVYNVALMPMSPIPPSQLTSEQVCKQVFPGSVKKLESNDNDVNLDISFSEITVPQLSNIDFYSHKSVGRNCFEDRLEKEEPHETASDSSNRPADSNRIGKENKENGFVSIRKSCKENGANLTRHVQVQFESLGNGVKPGLRCEKRAKISRKVLSDTSNILTPAEMESSGKWCCPQKNKPNLGPHLKQLQLGKWIRRV
ncbi:hypothetical protein CASFOL_023046 [Castilleja foliolosa]|uniref:Uncharacterized protein n=1 Tax=Castilleja foliolosa TaxID=1961234 RepID=A0ABD3CN92_9LAMI